MSQARKIYRMEAFEKGSIPVNQHLSFSRSIASLARSLRLSLIPWRSATSPNCSNTEFIAGRGQGNGREISPRKGSRTKDQRMKSPNRLIFSSKSWPDLGRNSDDACERPLIAVNFHLII